MSTPLSKAKSADDQNVAPLSEEQRRKDTSEQSPLPTNDSYPSTSGPFITVNQPEESDGELIHIQREDLKSDDEFQTASECTVRCSVSPTYDSASECGARYSPWWEQDKNIDEGISKQKMVLAVGCPTLPAPSEVLKPSPDVPPGKIVHEVIETTHIRVEHSHTLGVKSFVLSSETVSDRRNETCDSSCETFVGRENDLKETMNDESEGIKKKLEECGNWLQLKILEITPELTKLGATLSEALELQKAHNEVLRQLQNKQSPVEELLRQADQLIATQKPRAEVYAAMAETLARAWGDINFNLELRKHILELNVHYHRKAAEFFDKTKTLEESCKDTVIPIEIQSVKEFLTNIHEIRRSLLETLMSALQAGNSLLGKLKELGAEGTLDSRPEHIRQSVNKALSQVQSWLDELHLKRQDVELIFNRRKLQLEQCLALAILAADLRELEGAVVNCRSRLSNADQLGDSASSAELLLHENQKLLPDAQQLQEKAIKITKATEQLLASGCFAGEEATKQSYTVLSLTSDYLTEVQMRNTLLERVLAFFRSAQLAFNDLDQLEIKLSTTSLKSTSPALSQLYSQCLQAIDEITTGPIAEGYAIINTTGRGSGGLDGIKRTVEELENVKIRLHTLCVTQQEQSSRIERSLNTFSETYSGISTWLSSIAEAFLQSHQNMGTNLPEAQDFMDLHRKLLADLQDKGNEINSLLLTVPPLLDFLDDERRREIDVKVENLHGNWMNLKSLLENRLDLGRIYVKFHTEANIVNSEIDRLEVELQSRDGDIDDLTLRNLEIKWESLEPLYQSAKNTGLTFMSDAKKVSEPHLDTNRACVCVESVLQKLSGRQLQVTRNWQSFFTETVEKRELLVKLEDTIMESTKTINWVTKLEAQLYPVITINSSSPKDISAFIDNKLGTILPDIKRAQSEVKQKIETAESIIVKCQTKDEKAINIKNKLCELNHKLIEITNDYQQLLQGLLDYFKNLSDIEQTTENLSSELWHSTVSNYHGSQIKSAMTEHETTSQKTFEMLQTMQNDCDRISTQIRRQEPPNAAEHDINKLSYIMEFIIANWKEHSERKRNHLAKQLRFCQFDEDLQDINKSISNLEEHNQELRSRYGKSLEEAETSSAAYAIFEKTIEELDSKIKNFVLYGQQLIEDQHSQSPVINQHIEELQTRWNTFKEHVRQTRGGIDLSIPYLKLIKEAENWFKEGSRLLVSIASRSAMVKKPQEAEDLLKEIAEFLRPGEEQQNRRIARITELAERIYGVNLSRHLSQVVDENREMLKSFSMVREELDTLSKNLLKAEEERKRIQKEQEEVAAELARQRAEAQAAEEARIAAEIAKQEAEAQAAEEVRIAAELAKQEDEAKTAEEARVAAELAKQKAQAQAAEEARISSELARRKEEARAAEDARIAAEQAEKEREAAERRSESVQQKAERQVAEKLEKDIKISNEAEMPALEHRRGELIQKREIHSITRSSHILQEIPISTSSTSSERNCFPESKPLERPVFISPLTDAVIEEGSKFSFICRVTGSPIPIITWFKDGLPIQNNPDYRTSCEGGVCTLKIEETFSDDSARYICRAMNAAGTAETSASLCVKETQSEEQLVPPSFTKLLEPACIKEGSSFSFICKVQGHPLPNVQWFKNQECIDFSPGYQITYNNGEAILRFERIELKDKSEYTCKAINEIGTAQSTASLSVTPAIPTKAPSIIVPLSNIMARAGQKIKLECEIGGIPSPEITWLQNGLPLKENREVKLHREGDTVTLVIYEAFPKDAGTFKLIASNIAGEASTTCSVSVKGRLPNETSDSEIASDMEPVKPSIQLPLVDVTINEGSRVRLDCVIVGQPEPEVIWYHNNRPVKESSDFQLLFQGDRCSLVIHEALSEDGGDYRVVALNSAGEASSCCNLTVKPNIEPTTLTKEVAERMIPIGYPPKFNKLLNDVLVSEGETVIFEGNIIGKPKPEIKWLLNNLPITLDENVNLVHDDEGDIKLEIKKVKPQDKGVYTVKASNEHGEAKCFAQLIVKSSKISEPTKFQETKSAPKFVEKFGDKIAFENTPCKFECVVTGKPVPKVRWHINGEPLSETYNSSISNIGERQILSLPNISRMNEGKITCIAENEIGVASCSANITVHPLSTITLPESVSVNDQFDSKFSMKREVHTESSTLMSSKITLSGLGKSEPETKMHIVSSHDQKTFRQVNQQAPEISETHEVEEYLKLGNSEPVIHEKSSSIFSNEQSITQKQINHSSLQKPTIKLRPPKFVTPVVGKIVDQNTNVILEGIVDGQPTPSVSWSKNGKEILPSDRILVRWELNKASLEIKDTNTNDAGRYTCSAINESGTAISTADLVVRKTIFPPVFGRRLQAQVIKKGDRIVMEIEVTGTPEPVVTWFKDSLPIEQALGDSYRMKIMGNSHSLIIEKADLKHSGRFMVRAVNSGGEAQSIADMAVFEPTPDTMVEVVKTVVFEDVRKHDTLASSVDKISSSVSSDSKQLSEDSYKDFHPSTKPDTTVFENSISSSFKSEMSSFSEQQSSQSVSKARLEYIAPEIPSPRPLDFIPMEKQSDFEIVTPTPQQDLIEAKEPELEEGIQTSSITKESSLNFFVKKIEESKGESYTPKIEPYKIFEGKRIESFIEKPEIESMPTRHYLQPALVTKLEASREDSHLITECGNEAEEFGLKPEPPAEVCFTPSNIQELKTESKTSTLSYRDSSFLPPSSNNQPNKLVQPFSPEQPIRAASPFIHRELSDITSSAVNYESFETSSFREQSGSQIRAISPRPEALEMEKLWTSKREYSRPLSATEVNTPAPPATLRSHSSMSNREIVTETPRIHYIANVSHCIEPCEKKLENLLSRTGFVEQKYQFDSKNVYMQKEFRSITKPEHVSISHHGKYPNMKELTMRPASVQDITNEVYLEPGSPPVIDYAEPPTERRRSYVESVEQELETKIEKVPTKVPPGGVRTIPPPPQKTLPPPLPPKKEQPLAPPIPAKPLKNESVRKVVMMDNTSSLEAFPFKPDPEKPKTPKLRPPPTPSKFIKGKFTDSDYESDFESARIPPKWKPCSSDNEDPSYRRVKAPSMKEVKRSRSTEPEPLAPSKFDEPPEIRGPPRPVLKFEKVPSKSSSNKFTKQHEDIEKPEKIVTIQIKPGTPPLYIESPQKQHDSPKMRRKIIVDGYMADTDEPFFQQRSNRTELHEEGQNFSRHEFKSENVLESSQKFTTESSSSNKVFFPKKQNVPYCQVKKELTATPIVKNVSSEKREEVYEKQSRIEKRSMIQEEMKPSSVKYAPPPSPSKFVKGEFRESDYESDFDKPIPNVWVPSGQDDTYSYKSLKPILAFTEIKSSKSMSRPKFEPIDKPVSTLTSGEITRPTPISAAITKETTTFIPIRPGSPPELVYASAPQRTQMYRSTTSLPYHNAIQTETSNKVHFKESNEKCHRTVSVEQSTKVIKFGDSKARTQSQFSSEAPQTKKIVPLPSTPKKFIPGEFRESDYESDVENVKFKQKWVPSGSDTEDLHYRPVKPIQYNSRSSSDLPNKDLVEPNRYSQTKVVDIVDGSTSRCEIYNPTRIEKLEPGTPPEYGYVTDSRFKSKASTIASHHMENMTQQFKSKTQKFVRDIMEDVEHKSQPKKSILKKGEDEDPQVYREENRAAQYGTKHVDPDTGLIYFKYDFGYEFGIVLPGESENGGIPVPPRTILEPPKRTTDIEMPVYHETTNTNAKPLKTKLNKIKDKNIKWEPTSESELSEYEGNSKRISKGWRWEPSSCSPVSLSPSLPSNSPAFNNSFAGSEKRKPTDTPPSSPTTPVNAQKGTGQVRAPMFITPLRNIAVVSGQNAKFECIVQSEPPPNVLWSKNGRIIEDSNDYQIHFRNGVCRLTISRAYPEDAGTYTCSATNSAGNASTTAILDVPGEIRSAYIK